MSEEHIAIGILAINVWSRYENMLGDIKGFFVLHVLAVRVTLGGLCVHLLSDIRGLCYLHYVGCISYAHACFRIHIQRAILGGAHVYIRHGDVCIT